MVLLISGDFRVVSGFHWILRILGGLLEVSVGLGGFVVCGFWDGCLVCELFVLACLGCLFDSFYSVLVLTVCAVCCELT